MHLEITVRGKWENHSQPAKDPGIHCIRYQDCTCSQIWQFPKAMCRIKQIVPIAVSFLKFPWGHYIPVGSAMLAYCTVMIGILQIHADHRTYCACVLACCACMLAWCVQ